MYPFRLYNVHKPQLIQWRWSLSTEAQWAACSPHLLLSDSSKARTLFHRSLSGLPAAHTFFFWVIPTTPTPKWRWFHRVRCGESQESIKNQTRGFNNTIIRSLLTKIDLFWNTKKNRNSDCLPNATLVQHNLGREGSRGELGRVICSLPGCILCLLPSSDLQAHPILYSVYRVLCVSPNVLKLERTELLLQTQNTPDSQAWHFLIPRKITWIPIHEYLCHSTHDWIWKTQRKIGEEEPWFKWWLG